MPDYSISLTVTISEVEQKYHSNHYSQQHQEKFSPIEMNAL